MNWLPPEEHAGLQAERTDLAWVRTSLSFLVNGGLLVMRQHTIGAGWLTGLAVALAAILLILSVYMARRRRHVLEQSTRPARLADPVGMFMLAAGTALLGVVVVVELLARA